jgi:2-C-methyl-D-erythritol 4-phosphate cytidylyltransferase
MKKYAVIVAGGAGLRMGTPLPKQFLPLNGRPILGYTLDIFLRAYEDMEIILVAPPEHPEAVRTVVASSGAIDRIRVVNGGITRFHSVQNGLRLIEEEAQRGGGERGGAERDGLEPIEKEAVVFVHDGVRCLLTVDLVHRCYEQTLKFGSAVPVVDSKDSVRLLTGSGNRPVDRSQVKMVQTPQTFLSSMLLPAYETEYRLEYTDEATVVEAAGHPIHLVEGQVNNIKITTPADLAFAELLLGGRKEL